jgi:hypothetical protein
MNQLINNTLGGLHERQGLLAPILLRGLLLLISVWCGRIILKLDISKAEHLVVDEPSHRVEVGLDETMDWFVESLK